MDAMTKLAGWHEGPWRDLAIETERRRRRSVLVHAVAAFAKVPSSENRDAMFAAQREWLLFVGMLCAEDERRERLRRNETLPGRLLCLWRRVIRWATQHATF